MTSKNEIDFTLGRKTWCYFMKHSMKIRSYRREKTQKFGKKNVSVCENLLGVYEEQGLRNIRIDSAEDNHQGETVSVVTTENLEGVLLAKMEGNSPEPHYIQDQIRICIQNY